MLIETIQKELRKMSVYSGNLGYRNLQGEHSDLCRLLEGRRSIIKELLVKETRGIMTRFFEDNHKFLTVEQLENELLVYLQPYMHFWNISIDELIKEAFVW